jgi:alkyl hydroperoxide reductase subunit D
MTLDELKNQLPDYAKDLKLNLSSLINSQELPKSLLWGSLLAAAFASHNKTVISVFHNEAKNYLTEEEITAVKAAAAIMAMNNIYYRFTHLISKNEYATLPAGLRMNIMANPGVEKKDFEYWSFVVSAINGCGKCLDAHEAVLVKSGLSLNLIQIGAKIAAVIHGIARTLDIEEAIA